jgi:hypothetical protein
MMILVRCIGVLMQSQFCICLVWLLRYGFRIVAVIVLLAIATASLPGFIRESTIQLIDAHPSISSAWFFSDCSGLGRPDHVAITA